LSARRPAPADEASLSIVAGAVAPGVFDTLEIVAAAAGFYRDERLNVTKDYAGGSSNAVQLVAGGKADVASTAVEPVLIGYEKGIRLQFFLARQAQFSHALGVLAESPIATLADFKGKVLGETDVGSAGEVIARSMLSGAGLRSTDYSFVPIGIGAQGLSALLGKRVDGAVYPVLEFLNDELVAHASFRLFHHPILYNMGNVGYCATPVTIGAKGDALRRFSRAIVKAAVFVRTSPAATARLYLQSTGQPLSAEALASKTLLYTRLRDFFPAANPSNERIGELSPPEMSLYTKYLTDFGLMHSPLPGSAVATDQFIAFANDFNHRAVQKLANGME
jgi:NitT/TauT family transport system substrate-binding protein